MINRAALVCLLLVLCLGQAADQPFIVEPYIQMGDAPSLSGSYSLLVMWHAADVDESWDVEVQQSAGAKWSAPVHPDFSKVAVRGIEPHRVYRAQLTRLQPGEEFVYRVRRAEQSVFQARARARKTKDQPYRVAIFGDCAQGTPEQRAVAYRVYQAKPDLVFIPGDIVYSRGLISEYRTKFYPVYNAPTASPETGAPLIRSTLFTAAPGNHDSLKPNLTRDPDALAYFSYWSQPLNGPVLKVDGPNTPVIVGTDEEKDAFLAGASASYPRMSNFSFDYGNAHWTVLDANPHVDWTDAGLREWLTKDLASAKGATWRFVGFHHPGFNSAHEHFTDQWMRLVSDILEAGHVDLVFAGHVHNYQRSFPLRFQAKVTEPGLKGVVDGKWTLDKEFNGTTRTKPNGVIYVVSGAGGAKLYNPEQQAQPESWQPFTHKFISTVNSFTVVDASGGRLTIRQISKDGEDLDRFVVTKNSSD